MISVFPVEESGLVVIFPVPLTQIRCCCLYDQCFHRRGNRCCSQEHRQETIVVYMTYVCGGAGIIMILSVCQCQEHTTDYCLCDPCFHGGAVKSGIYCQCKKHV